jgi:uncharacterized delta-60 repeat protein
VQGKGRPHRAVAALAAALGLVLTQSAGAAPGDLDPSFGGDGRLALPAAGAFVPRAVTVDAAQRIVVAGYLCKPGESGDATCLADGDSSFRLARLTPDGGLDAEFGENGFVTTPLGDGRSQALDITLDPQGRIVAAGVARLEDRDVFALARYRPDGSLDPSFGGGGVALDAAGASYASLGDVALGPGNTLIAAGQAVDGEGRPRMAVARFTETGALDATFGSGGIVLGGGRFGYSLGLAVTGSGAPLAAGVSSPTADGRGYHFGELRLDTGGRFDQAFDGDGYAEQHPGASASFANAVVALPAGGFVAAGAATVADGRQAMAVLKGTDAGALDPAFANAGVRLLPLHEGAVANDVLVDGKGKLLVVGQAARGGGYAFTINRLTAGGRVDSGFDDGGVAWRDYPIARATAAVLQRPDRLVTVGLGCSSGTAARCRGGTPVLLVARQLAGTRGPSIRVPSRVTRARLRRGVRLRVELARSAHLEARLVGRRWNGGRIVLTQVRSAKPRATYSLRLRARRRAVAATRPGRLRLTLKAGTTRATRTITLRG